MIHWQIERDEDGRPVRLVWSSEWQRAMEAWARWDAQQDAEEEAKRSLPMPSMRKWLEERGGKP